MHVNQRFSVAVTCLLLMLLSVGLEAQSTASVTPPALLLRHATLLDGVNLNPQLDVAITIRGGRIESVRPDDEGAASSADPDSVIDLHGAWVMPGLIDAHAHIGVSRIWGEPDSVAAQRALDGGVTTVRSMGNVPGFGDLALRTRALESDARLPRIVAAGEWIVPVVSEDWLRDFPTLRPLLTPAIAEDSLLLLFEPPGWRLSGNDVAIDSVVRMLATRGADWVKVFATGRAGTGNPRTSLLTERDLTTAVLAARRSGLHVAAHAYTDEGIGAAVRAGARTIEHGASATEGSLRLMLERGACLVPTLIAFDDVPADSAARGRAQEMRAAAYRAVRLAHNLGVTVIAGSDMPYWPGGEGVVAELLALVEAGLTPDQVLHAATSQAAACLDVAGQTGSVTPGLEADLLVLDGDPRSNLSLLERPKLVILGGRLVRRVPVAEIVHSVLLNDGIEAARERARVLHASRVDSLRYGEYELIGLGARLGMEGRIPEALAMLEVNVEVHPDAPNAWDALGQALLVVERPDDARHAFERAVDLAEKQGDPRLPEFRANLDRVRTPD